MLERTVRGDCSTGRRLELGEITEPNCLESRGGACTEPLAMASGALLLGLPMTSGEVAGAFSLMTSTIDFVGTGRLNCPGMIFTGFPQEKLSPGSMSRSCGRDNS